MKGKALTAAEKKTIRSARSRGESPGTIAKDLGLNVRTVQRVLARPRTADEFDKAPSLAAAPRKNSGPAEWTLELIRAARNDQLRGKFAQPVRLAESMMADDAIFTAYRNRTDPLWAVSAKLKPYPGVTGDRVLVKANRFVSTPRSVIASIHKSLVHHEVAIGQVIREPSEDGAHVGVRLKAWPLEHVQYNTSTEFLETKTEDGKVIPIVHGDGQWVIFRRIEDKPWTQATLIAAAMIYAAHTTGLADWAGALRSHGLAKVVGQLQEGTALMNEAGSLTPEASAFLDLLVNMVSGGAEAGILPPGATADFISNSSSAWQIFSEMILGREKAAARVYLGTDASLGSQGGAPGVDISTLFGVATTKLQGDFAAIEEGINSGLIAPWAAINFGDSSHAPKIEYQLPDPDKEAKSLEEGNRDDRLMNAIQRRRELGLRVTQDDINELAARFGVPEAPQLPADV